MRATKASLASLTLSNRYPVTRFIPVQDIEAINTHTKSVFSSSSDPLIPAASNKLQDWNYLTIGLCSVAHPDCGRTDSISNVVSMLRCQPPQGLNILVDIARRKGQMKPRPAVHHGQKHIGMPNSQVGTFRQRISWNKTLATKMWKHQFIIWPKRMMQYERCRQMLVCWGWALKPYNDISSYTFQTWLWLIEPAEDKTA